VGNGGCLHTIRSLVVQAAINDGLHEKVVSTRIIQMGDFRKMSENLRNFPTHGFRAQMVQFPEKDGLSPTFYWRFS
jgi:hypothetical protein